MYTSWIKITFVQTVKEKHLILFRYSGKSKSICVCLNAHHDENASYSTCSLIRKAVQMAFFDREENMESYQLFAAN